MWLRVDNIAVAETKAHFSYTCTLRTIDADGVHPAIAAVFLEWASIGR